mmetsp:Transcript_62876/g.137415  ORF Transcript_62876/g.137415 Transcript_62876/m.137415 type:complete len:164 (+) Transcript_62876:79-570(+)
MFSFGLTCCTSSSSKGNEVLRDDGPTFLVDTEAPLKMPRATLSAQRTPVRVSLGADIPDCCPPSPQDPVCKTKSEDGRSTASTRTPSVFGDEDSTCRSRDLADFLTTIPETGINLRQRRCLPGLQVQTKNLQTKKADSAFWTLKAQGHLASRSNPPFEVSVTV